MTRTLARSLVWTVALLLAYGLAIQILRPQVSKAPSQYLNNRFFIESYLYGADARDVFTGSSLTRRLAAADLPPGAANIAVSAGDALTGLAIVLRSGKQPARVYFEINKLDESLDQTLVDDVFAQPLHGARRHVLALRLTYQPMTVLFNLLRGSRPEAEVRVLPENVKKAIALNRQKSAVLVPRRDLDRDVALLKSLAAKARARNIQLVFFEMPVDDALKDLPRPSQIRDAVRRAFPPQESCWLYPVVPSGAHTLDGLHLTAADAHIVALQLRDAPACNRP